MGRSVTRKTLVGLLVGSILCLAFSVVATFSKLHLPETMDGGNLYSFQPMLDLLEDRPAPHSDSNDDDDNKDDSDSKEKEEDQNQRDGNPDTKVHRNTTLLSPDSSFHRNKFHRHDIKPPPPPFIPFKQKRPPKYASLKDVPMQNIVERYSKRGHVGGGSGGRHPPRRGNNNKILFLVHIHKSAGSSLCHMAKRNRLRVRSRTNCNVQPDQRCCGGKDTIAAQEYFANTTLYDLVAIETEMYDSMVPQYYDYIVILRNSRARYFSHWLHVLRYYNSTTAGTFPQWWSGQPDNWNTRVLCGPRCLQPNKYALTRDMFQYTLDRLRLFEDILFVEDMAHSFRKFTKKHQWTGMPMIEKNTALDVTWKKSNEQNRNFLLPLLKNDARDSEAHDWDPLMSALDNALYEFGQRKEAGLEPFDNFTVSVQQELDQYFDTGPFRNCTNICCGTTCSVYR
jgi:hypothetical protein